MIGLGIWTLVILPLIIQVDLGKSSKVSALLNGSNSTIFLASRNLFSASKSGMNVTALLNIRVYCHLTANLTVTKMRLYLSFRTLSMQIISFSSVMIFCI